MINVALNGSVKHDSANLYRHYVFSGLPLMCSAACKHDHYIQRLAAHVFSLMVHVIWLIF